VVWVTEFGRMRHSKGATAGTTIRGLHVGLAGAGVKRAFSYGATDDFGHIAIDKPSSIYDLHATVLHLLGLNHERLASTTRHRTPAHDVHGHVLTEILS